MSAPANFNNQRPVINPADAVMLLIDHPKRLISKPIGDMPMPDLRRHATSSGENCHAGQHASDYHGFGAQGPNGH
jgi:hypothetical protein